jgi:hypothetical protein
MISSAAHPRWPPCVIFPLKNTLVRFSYYIRGAITMSCFHLISLFYTLFQPLIKFKNNLYYEEKDYISEAEKSLKPSPGSKVSKVDIYIYLFIINLTIFGGEGL